MNALVNLFGEPTSDEVRNRVFAFEECMRQQEQIEMPVVNYFSHGVYARELHIPAGALLTGEIHKYTNLNILSKGDISVLTDEGVKRIQAPFTIVSPAGTKRIAYAHTDCIWTTIHGTHERDIDKIKQFFIAGSEAEYLDFCGQLTLELKAAC